MGKNTSVLLEVLPSRCREDRRAFCARSCAAEALRSGHSAVLSSARSAPTVDISFFFFFLKSLFIRELKDVPCAAFSEADAAHSALIAAFKFGLKGAPLEVYVPRARKGRYDVHILQNLSHPPDLNNKKKRSNRSSGSDTVVPTPICSACWLRVGTD